MVNVFLVVLRVVVVGLGVTKNLLVVLLVVVVVVVVVVVGRVWNEEKNWKFFSLQIFFYRFAEEQTLSWKEILVIGVCCFSRLQL